MKNKKILPALGVGLAAAALLAAAAGALHLLNSRAQQAPGQPTVTADSLGGTDLAQSALTAAAGDGRDYIYKYAQEDVDAAVEEHRMALEKEKEAAKAEADRYRAEGDTEAAEIREESVRYLEAHLDEMLEEVRALWTKEAEMAKDAIPPQDAANIAGAWFEQVYGIELNDTPLWLSFTYNEKGPLSWTAVLEGMPDRRTVSLTLDALTGRVVQAIHIYGQAKQEALEAQPLPAGAVPQRENGFVYGYDLSGLEADTLASYQAEVERIISLDTVSAPEGGTGWNVEIEISDLGVGGTADYVMAHVRYANGKTAELQRLFPQGTEEYPARLWLYTAGEAVA